MSGHWIELIVALLMIIGTILRVLTEEDKKKKKKSAQEAGESNPDSDATEDKEGEDVIGEVHIPEKAIEFATSLREILSPRNWLPQTRKEWIVNGSFVLIASGLFYFFFPGTFSKIVYQFLYVRMFYLLPLGLGLAALMFAGKLYLSKKRSLGITYGIAAVLIMYGGSKLLSSLNEWYICRHYTFEPVSVMPPIERNALRFTPDSVAWNDMLQDFGSSDYTLHYENVRALNYQGGFGYIVPITPDGLMNRWWKKVDGFMVYDDNPDTGKGNKRVRRIRERFEYGEDLMFLDNIWRQLYLRDPFTEYTELYYLESGGDEETILTVAPRIRYTWKFPCFFVPTFAGLAVVHPNGRIEHLDAEQALADTRFAGKPIYPRELTLREVTAQVYDQGLFIGMFRHWYTPANMIRVPSIPHSTQMPYYTPLENGAADWVVSTEPAGQSYALFRQYLVDAHDGTRRVVTFNPDEGVLGPERALQRVHALAGYRWIDPWKGNEGDFRVVEAVIIPRGDRIFWKYTVTTNSYVGIVLTAVVDATTNELFVFHSRESFYDWYDGKGVEQGALVGDDFKELRALLDQVNKMVEGLEDKVTP